MTKFYNLNKIDKKKATYNVIFGERSNGKTYAVLKKGLVEYLKDGSQLAYVRRWQEDITGRRASRLYAGLNESGEVERLSKGVFKGVHYWAGKFYLCNYDDAGKAIFSDLDIIAFTFAVSAGEHDKSTSFPNIRLIMFDEFLTSKLYLPDEFILFMNIISTIVRKREDVKIYMLGNTVNKFSPYFTEMGLSNVSTMKQGAIDVYHYGTSKLTVAVEFCDNLNKHQPSNKYFAFDNPKLEMITGGTWELSIYPHLPIKYKPNNVLLSYYIDFNDLLFKCDVVNIDDIYFTYIQEKTTPLKHLNDDLIYTLDHNPRANYSRSIFRPINKTQEKILWFFKTDRVYYQNNEIGDTINNYLKIVRRG